MSYSSSPLKRMAFVSLAAQLVGMVRVVPLDELDYEIAQSEAHCATLPAGSKAREHADEAHAVLCLLREWVNAARERLLSPAEMEQLQADYLAEKGGKR